MSSWRKTCVSKEAVRLLEALRSKLQSTIGVLLFCATSMTFLETHLLSDFKKRDAPPGRAGGASGELKMEFQCGPTSLLIVVCDRLKS